MSLNQPEQQKPSPDLKRLRTYESDVQELLQKQEVSKATIALAESEREIQRKAVAAKPSPEPPAMSPAKVFRIGNALPLHPVWNIRLIVLIALGIAALAGVSLGAFFLFKEPPSTAPAPKTEPAVRVISLTGSERRAGMLSAIQKGLQTISVPQNEIRAVPVRYGGAELDTPTLLGVLESGASPTFIRALGAVPVLGLHGFQGGQPFMLFPVSSYDHAFAEMLRWEKSLLSDMGPLFGVHPRNLLEQQVGSTTEEALENRIIFKDVIVRNKDARGAFDPEGAIVFIYSFIDKQTLVLTTSEDTVRALQSKAGGGKLR